MADSALTATLDYSVDVGQAILAHFSIAIAAGDYVTDGNTVSLQVAGVKTLKAPLATIAVRSTNGNPTPAFTKGTSLTNGKLILWTTTPGTQVTAGAMPAAYTGDTIKLLVLLSKG